MKRKDVFQAVQTASVHGIAIEAIINAEEQFMNGDVTQDDMDELNAHRYGHDDGITQMAYKNDDGMWQLTGSYIEYSSYEELIENV